jgi:protein-tyrosine phosphatase
VQLCLFGHVDPQPDYAKGVTCRNLSMDWPWLWRNLRANKGDQELATVGARELLGEAWRTLSLREHFDAFSLDDRGPGWAELRSVARDLARILMKKSARLPFRVPLLRGLLTTRFRRRAAESSRLLFVCKGNICRSNFAEHYARRVLPAYFELSSSGSYPHADRRAPAEAVEAARGFGIDLARHRSRVLSQEELGRADLVLVFDQENLERVVRDFPRAEDKLFRLGALCPGGSVDLRDPYGGDLTTFEGVYGEIAAALDVMAELVTARAPRALEEPGP